MYIDDYRALQEFYQQHLATVILPFWLEQGIDTEQGGFFTCFDNRGERLVSFDKYTWSQGRMIWLLARLSELSRAGLLQHDANRLLVLAGQGVEFVRQHAFLANGNCAYLLDRYGNKQEALPGKGLDISFFADCFVALGFSEYARVARDAEVLEQALTLCTHIIQRLKAGAVRSEPYPIPDGYEAHSTSMIMLNVTQELASALEAFGDARAAEVRKLSFAYMQAIMERFYQPGGLIAEILPLQSASQESVLCRHVTPGHAIESMWFVLREARLQGQQQWLKPATQAIAKAFAVGWDQDYGGLFRFVDRNGGQPGGLQMGTPYEQLILDTWDTKLWWPHSEALYGTLLAYELSGERIFAELYQQVHEYVFKTFPHPEQPAGEWIQIRDRQGQPIDKVVALPVKDPYHIIRNLVLIIELLQAHLPRA
ncbi:N-acylglucosamine 2-epimerase [Ktedonosporobacter rubrisoli]|uniref:N-acylglucosamine 2-epimerase n=1 Tax=Ktedonosporobacter rubrisoli TaxID=2509675 RepID=A0A4P6JHW8_KTERU|nr:AGE family epimerase/isomerase [Ktedonosporobacter rubrisoli]QBD74635.1 N-acylglucosamine 2-epimerase [Ktedonosporobacter rubrisoli]